MSAGAPSETEEIERLLAEARAAQERYDAVSWRRFGEEALARAERAGDEALIARALVAVAGVPSVPRVRVRAMLDRALALAERLGRLEIAGQAQSLLGFVLCAEGDPTTAIRLLETAAERLRDFPEDRVVTLGRLAIARVESGRLAEALVAVEGAAGVPVGPSARAYLAWCTGRVAEARGDVEGARGVFESTLATLGDDAPHLKVRMYGALGTLCVRASRHAEAEAWFERMVAVNQDPNSAGIAHLNLALLLARGEREDTALAHLDAISPELFARYPMWGACDAAVRVARAARFAPADAALAFEDYLAHDGANAMFLRATGDVLARAASLLLAANDLALAARIAAFTENRALLEQLGDRGAPAVVLDRFALEHPIGRGAMGEVWRARHLRDGVPVAVKFVTSAEVATSREALLRELRAAAGLDHPNVAAVYDTGVVSLALAWQSRGYFPEGAPLLVMQLATGGSLEPWCGRLTWDAIRSLLLELLDGLGHAHARGLVHLDIKPANVLLATADPPQGARLADFGLARALAGSPGQLGGSPSYMAPELVTGNWREIGPWTDLYAVGCLGWALWTGAPPFAEGAAQAIFAAQVGRQLPALSRAAPPGVEAWLRKLLAKDPGARFRFAADAAAALDAAPRPAHGVRPPAVYAPPLRLLGLRAPHLVGREGAQAAVRSALREVPSCSRGFRVHGAPGLGKTAFLQWAASEAHQAGFDVWRGTTLREVAIGGLRIEGLTGAALAAQVRRAVRILAPGADPDLEPLVEALAGGGDALVAALVALVGELSMLRPAAVVLDDADGDTEATAFAERLLNRPAAKVLVVAALGRERPALGPTLVLEPLERSAAMRLITGLLPVDVDSAGAIAAQGGGNPQLLVELVRATAERGLFVEAPWGFTLRAGATIQVPDDVHELWRARTEALASSPRSRRTLEMGAVLGSPLDPAVWANACVLADADPPAEWVPRLVEEGLLRPTDLGWTFAHTAWHRSLLRDADEGGRLAVLHGAAAAALSDRAPGRRGMHLLAAGAAAAALVALRKGIQAAVDASDIAEIERLCPLWEAAFAASGVPEESPEAISGMVVVAGAAGVRRDAARAARWSMHVAPLARAAGDREALLRALVFQVQANRGRVALAEVAPVAAEAVALARALARPALEAAVLHSLGIAHRFAGDLPEAEALLRASIALGNRNALHDLAVLLRNRGELVEAEALARDAVAWARNADRSQLGTSLHLLGTIEANRGDPFRAEALFLESIAHLDARGRLDAIISCLSLAHSQFERGAMGAVLELLPELAQRAARLGDPEILAGVAAYELACAVADEEPATFLAAAARMEGRIAALRGPAPIPRDVLRVAARMAESAGYPDRAAHARSLAEQAVAGAP